MADTKTTLVFVDTAKEGKVALDLLRVQSKKEKIVVLATTPEAQNVLAKNDLDYTSYMKLLPNSAWVTRTVKLANKFATTWHLNTPLENPLQVSGINIAYYLIGYWTNLLILFLLSGYVIKEAQKVYDPQKIIYFSKDLPPEQAINTDYHILETCGQRILGGSVTLQKQILSDNEIKPKSSYWWWKKMLEIMQHKNNFPIIFKLLLHDFRCQFVNLEPKVGQAEVLIYGDKHIIVNSIALIKKLQQDFSVQTMGAMLSLEQKLKLAKARITFETFENLNRGKAQPLRVNEIKRSWNKFSKSEKYQKLLTQFHLSDLEVAISNGFASYFARHLPNVFTTLDQTNYLMRNVRPKASVLFGNYGKKGLSISYLTQQQGGKVIILEHGIVPNPIQIHPPIFDRMLFWGEWSRQAYYQAFHEPRDKQSVVGWYLTDDILAKMESERKQVHKKPNVPIDKLTILLLTTFPLYDFPKQLKMVTQVISSLGKMGIQEFILRPHPGEKMPPDLYVKNLRKDFTLSLDWGKDLDGQIRRSDMVITEGTSVALRAMLWGRPVLHLITENVTDITNFSMFGAAAKIDEIEKLPEAVKILSSSPSARRRMLSGQKKLLELFCYKLDGLAGERVATEISKLIH